MGLLLSLLLACGAYGPEDCFVGYDKWRHLPSRVADQCAGPAQLGHLAGVVGDAPWVQTGDTWTGEALVVGGVPEGAWLTAQLCTNSVADDKEDHRATCRGLRRTLGEEVTLAGTTVELVAPSAGDADACLAEASDVDVPPLDPGPALPTSCTRNFGYLLRLYDADGSLVSERLETLRAFSAFPAPAPNPDHAPLDEVAVQDDDGVLTITLSGRAAPALAGWYDLHRAYLPATWRVWPDAGAVPGDVRFGALERRGRNLSITFQWAPEGATATTALVRLDDARAMFGQRVEIVSLYEVQLAEVDGQWEGTVARVRRGR